MPREQIQRLALPAPVLHDLRGQLDEIPGHAGARQAAHLHAAQQMMQQVAELVKDGLHFAMRQQRGLAVHGRRQIAADQAQMRLALGRVAGDQRVHPGAAALVFARKPVGVEGAEIGCRAVAAIVVHRVGAHVRIPRRARRFPPRRGCPARGRKYRTFRSPHVPAENTGAAPLHRNRRARRAASPPNSRCPRAEVVQDGRMPANASSSWFSSRKRGSVFCAQIVEKALRARAGVRHAVVQHQIGEIAEAQQLRLFACADRGS